MDTLSVTIIKQNETGQETWRYPGKIIVQEEDRIIIEATFNYPRPVEIHSLTLCPGDRFVETFFSERWYNIFEIYDRHDNRLKGWYCNITTPATLPHPGSNNPNNPNLPEPQIRYRDLALDLVVLPDGTQITLDMDEFEALDLSPNLKASALDALAELRAYFRQQFKTTS